MDHAEARLKPVISTETSARNQTLETPEKNEPEKYNVRTLSLQHVSRGRNQKHSQGHEDTTEALYAGQTACNTIAC